MDQKEKSAEKKHEKLVLPDSRMQIVLIEGKFETCLVSEWEDQQKLGGCVIKHEDCEIFIPYSAIIKIIFKKK